MKTIITAKTRSKVINNSILELNNNGTTQTGRSGYSKGWANKSIWTSEVAAILDSEGISYERGNDAPRGGASGEYVRITCPIFLAAVEVRKAQRETDRRAAELAALIAQTERDQQLAEAVSLIEPIEGEDFQQTCGRLGAALGKTIDSNIFYKAVRIIRKK